MLNEEVIAEVGRRLLATAPAGTRVVLFGSHARGEAGRRSDLDLLVIEPAVTDAVEEAVRLRKALRGMVIAADIIVVSDEEANDWRDVYGSVIHAALQEGRPLAA